MSGPTDPAEEHFDKGLWGWGSTIWEKLVSTGTGLLKVQVGGQDADVEVKQAAPADLAVGLHGWDGSAWRKNPLQLGFNSKYREREQMSATGAGNTMDTTPVPAGEIWVICSAMCFDYTHACGPASLNVYDGTNTYTLNRAATLAASEALTFQGTMPLVEGERIRAAFGGLTVGDSIYCDVVGYKMVVY